MTNREFIKMCLDNEIDDDGASRDMEIERHIACPYHSGDKRCECNGLDYDDFTKDVCIKCKSKWLESEVDE